MRLGLVKGLDACGKRTGGALTNFRGKSSFLLESKIMLVDKTHDAIEFLGISAERDTEVSD